MTDRLMRDAVTKRLGVTAEGRTKMNISRREFFAFLGSGVAATAFPVGFLPNFGSCRIRAKIALQLYSINTYIGGKKDRNGRVIVPGVGLEKALEEIAANGFKGVEFAGYYGFEAKAIRKILAGTGLKACATHVATSAYGLDTKAWTYDPDVLKTTCEFNLGYGNNLIICPGGGNFPPGCSWSVGCGGESCKTSQAIDDFTKRLVESYNRVAADAAKMGCQIGLHNHSWEHAVFMRDGTSFWDYFFSNTSENVCMEQDVGWSTCAGVDPKRQYVKYPHRSPTLHAKENGMGKGVVRFDAILGRPGCDKDGNPCATPVDWDGLIPVSEKDGVEWYVVECERHFDDLSAVLPSYDFLKSKGLN